MQPWTVAFLAARAVLRTTRLVWPLSVVPAAYVHARLLAHAAWTVPRCGPERKVPVGPESRACAKLTSKWGAQNGQSSANRAPAHLFLGDVGHSADTVFGILCVVYVFRGPPSVPPVGQGD